MGKYSKKKVHKTNKKQLWIAGCVVGVVALIVAACFLLRSEDDTFTYNPERGPLKELTVSQPARQGEMMKVETSYGAVEFPYAFSDLISVKPLTQGNQTALAFTAKINGKNYDLYTIWFNGSEGSIIGTMDLNDGEKPVAVTLVFYNATLDLSGDSLTTFHATQETVNEVIASLEKIPAFTAGK